MCLGFVFGKIVCDSDGGAYDLAGLHKTYISKVSLDKI